MPHIHTEPGQHDTTVTVYIVRTDLPEPVCFLHMHRKLGKLLPVGGHVELHETPWQSVLHELEEEAGYTQEQIAVFQPPVRIRELPGSKLHPYPIVLNTHDIGDTHWHSDIAFAIEVLGEPQGALADGESTDIRWLTYQELRDTPADLLFGGTRPVYEFFFEHVLPTWERVSPSVFAE